MQSVQEEFENLKEKFETRFRTHEQLKIEIQKQMSTIVTVAVNNVRDAFLSMNESNRNSMEKLSSEIEAKGYAGDDEDRIELQKLRDKTLY